MPAQDFNGLYERMEGRSERSGLLSFTGLLYPPIPGAMRYDPFDEIRRDALDLVPPEPVAANAARGLVLRERFRRGGTEVGAGVAAGLGARERQTPDMIRRMVSYFARHEVDKRGRNFGNEQNPSAGHIAWLLWGGDAGRDWALAMKKRLQA